MSLKWLSLKRKIGNDQVRTIRVQLTEPMRIMGSITNDSRLYESYSDNPLEIASIWTRHRIAESKGKCNISKNV